MARLLISTFSTLALTFFSCCSPSTAMSVSATVGPADAPWDTPDPLTCVWQLQSLVGLGFNVGHESAGDLQTLIPICYEWDPQGSWHAHGLHGYWTCGTQNWSPITAQDGSILEMLGCYPSWKSNFLRWRHRTWIWSCILPVEQDEEPPGWWVKKIWHSYDGWLLVAKKEEFSLLIVDPPRQLDQRILVEETISSEGSMESQRQTMVANMSKRALQPFYTYQKMLYLLDQDLALLKMVITRCLWLCEAISQCRTSTRWLQLPTVDCSRTSLTQKIAPRIKKEHPAGQTAVFHYTHPISWLLHYYSFFDFVFDPLFKMLETHYWAHLSIVKLLVCFFESAWASCLTWSITSMISLFMGFGFMFEIHNTQVWQPFS